MRSLGFGLERIGIAVLRAPVAATVLMLVSLAIAATTIPGLQFYGLVIGIVDRTGTAYADFERQASEFRDSGRDVAVIVKNPGLMTVDGLEGVRDLHFELALADGIGEVFSVFSLGDFSPVDSNYEPSLPDSFADDADAARAIAELIDTTPAAASLIAPQKNAALIIVSLDIDEEIAEGELRSRMLDLRSLIRNTLAADTEFMLAGLPPVRVSVVQAIISDQTTLTMVGLLLGAVVSFLIFGNIVSAIICTLPGGIAVLWLLAMFSLSGVKLNFLTTVLPSLALIIAFADGVVLFFRWQSLNADNDDQLENLKQAILRVGPASALTSITTALAFLSFTYATSETMTDFAWFGVSAVILAFLAVIAGLPLACYWFIRLGGNKTRRKSPLALLGRWLTGPAAIRPALSVSASLVLLAVLSFGHTLLQPTYNLAKELPADSEIKAAESFMNETFGGTSQIFVMVPVTPGGTFGDQQNRQRISAIDERLSQLLGARYVVSLGRIWQRAEAQQIDSITRTIADLEPSQRDRLLSVDSRTMQAAVTVASGQDTEVDTRTVEAMRTALKEVGPTDDLIFTGMRVLIAKEFPNLINQLRTGLLIAVFLSVGFIMLATRSWRLGLAALVPNLLPILFAESIILVFGNTLDITNVIALTIAFGIAIDNGVHIINSYLAERRHGKAMEQAMQDAVREIGPALVASTTILCIATVITQFSSLPSVTVLGRLLVVTLIMALATNLVVLPGFIRVLSGEKNDTPG